jgi:hypothetical protein
MRCAAAAVMRLLWTDTHPFCVTDSEQSVVAIVPHGLLTEDVSLTEVVQARAILSHKRFDASHNGQLNACRGGAGLDANKGAEASSLDLTARTV